MKKSEKNALHTEENGSYEEIQSSSYFGVTWSVIKLQFFSIQSMYWMRHLDVSVYFQKGQRRLSS